MKLFGDEKAPKLLFIFIETRYNNRVLLLQKEKCNENKIKKKKLLGKILPL